MNCDTELTQRLHLIGVCQHSCPDFRQAAFGDFSSFAVVDAQDSATPGLGRTRYACHHSNATGPPPSLGVDALALGENGDITTVMPLPHKRWHRHVARRQGRHVGRGGERQPLEQPAQVAVRLAPVRLDRLDQAVQVRTRRRTALAPFST